MMLFDRHVRKIFLLNRIWEMWLFSVIKKIRFNLSNELLDGRMNNTVNVKGMVLIFTLKSTNWQDWLMKMPFNFIRFANMCQAIRYPLKANWSYEHAFDVQSTMTGLYIINVITGVSFKFSCKKTLKHGHELSVDMQSLKKKLLYKT